MRASLHDDEPASRVSPDEGRRRQVRDAVRAIRRVGREGTAQRAVQSRIVDPLRLGAVAQRIPSACAETDTDGPAADALPHTRAIGAKARHFRSRSEWIRSRLRCDPRRTISRPAMSAKLVDRDTLVGWPRRSGSVLNTAI